MQVRLASIQPPRSENSCASRLKLKLHAAEAGGVFMVLRVVGCRLKLKLHAAEAGGVFELSALKDHLTTNNRELQITLIIQRNQIRSLPFFNRAAIMI